MLIAADESMAVAARTEPGFTCRRGPNARCAARLSDADFRARCLIGIDLHIEVPAVTAARSHPAAARGGQP